MSEPISVLADAKGGFYLNDINRFRVQYVGADGAIRTVAGTGVSGGRADARPASESRINDVAAMALAPNGDLYLAESFNCRVSRIDAEGLLRFVAGDGTCGFAGDGGPALAAQLNAPQGLAFDPQGRLLIADTNNSRIRRVNASGTIETIAGTGNSQTFGANGTAALQTPISFPMTLASAADGTLYYAEWGYRRVRRIAPDGLVTTVAGDGNDGNSGDGGPAALARFRQVRAIALDAPRNRLFIADTVANRVRRVDLAAGTIANAVGITFSGALPPVFANSFSGDNGPPANAGLASPRYISVDPSGALYIADTGNNRIRRADSVIRTVAGRFFDTGDGPAIRAELNNPGVMAVTATGELLIADRGNRVIRRVTGAGITTIAGIPPERMPANTGASSSGDNGPATAAGFADLRSIAADSAGLIYILDNGRLRRIDGSSIAAVPVVNLPLTAQGLASDPARNRLFAIVPSEHKVLVANLAQAPVTFRDFAGAGTAGFTGDGGNATAARLDNPADVAVDAAGNVYIAVNARLRRVNPDGVITTVAGTGQRQTENPGTASTPALTTAIGPFSVAVDSGSGLVLFAESARSSYLRAFDPQTNTIRAIAGNTVRGIGGDGGYALGAFFAAVDVVRTGGDGRIYVKDAITGVVRVLRPVVLSRFEAVSGGGQSSAAGTRLAAPLVVRVATADGPIAGVPVVFNANAGATIIPATAFTGADGLARAEVTLGPVAGPVTITATVDGLNPVTFGATGTAGATVDPHRPAIRANGGVATAGAFGGRADIAPGTWMEIYGTNLAATTRSWGDADFRGTQAPTELDGVRVTVGGRSAFVAFISPTQINVQVPDGIGAGPVPVVVTTSSGASDPVTVTAASAAPALLAPPVFLVNGVQYVAALHQDGAFVGRPGLIAGANFRAAKPGDVLTLYGIGFGATSPATPAGQVASGTPALAGVTVRIGDREARLLYGGLAPGAVGLYQFNVVMPDGSGDLPVVLNVGTAATQTTMITAE